MNPNLVWGALFVIGSAYEGWTIKNAITGDTLSERTRAWFYTKTPWGRVFFSTFWIGFSGWFLVHILKG